MWFAFLMRKSVQMAHLSGVSRRPASLPRVQESSGIVSRGAGAEVTVARPGADPTKYLGVEHELYKILDWTIKRARIRDLD